MSQKQGREMVVADFYQLNRESGKFVKEGKKLLRSNVVLNIDYVNRINETSHESGKLYVVNDKATEKYYKESEEKRNPGSAAEPDAKPAKGKKDKDAEAPGTENAGGNENGDSGNQSGTDNQ